jgi:hypothetical protein
MTGIMNAYDPPMTVGRRVPKRVWSIVFIPVTNSTVCTTIALSCWKQTNKHVSIRMHPITETVDKKIIIRRDEFWIHASDAIA